MASKRHAPDEQVRAEQNGAASTTVIPGGTPGPRGFVNSLHRETTDDNRTILLGGSTTTQTRGSIFGVERDTFHHHTSHSSQINGWGCIRRRQQGTLSSETLDMVLRSSPARSPTSPPLPHSYISPSSHIPVSGGKVRPARLLREYVTLCHPRSRIGNVVERRRGSCGLFEQALERMRGTDSSFMDDYGMSRSTCAESGISESLSVQRDDWAFSRLTCADSGVIESPSTQGDASTCSAECPSSRQVSNETCSKDEDGHRENDEGDETTAPQPITTRQRLGTSGSAHSICNGAEQQSHGARLERRDSSGGVGGQGSDNRGNHSTRDGEANEQVGGKENSILSPSHHKTTGVRDKSLTSLFARMELISKISLSRDSYVGSNGCPIHMCYVMKDKLGQGTWGTVHLAVERSSGLYRAVKKVPKRFVKELYRFRQEMQVLRILDHPNIVRLYETFEDYANLYMVMELCTGGELFDLLAAEVRMSEARAARIMKQILLATQYCNSKNICHRDLKPENFLFVRKTVPQSPDNPRLPPAENNASSTTGSTLPPPHPISSSVPVGDLPPSSNAASLSNSSTSNMPYASYSSGEEEVIKLIDFGLAKRTSPSRRLHTKVGTLYYVAPQILSGKYDISCDMWSAGVILYVLVSGMPPFNGHTDAEICSKIQNNALVFTDPIWSKISASCKDLISRLLEYNPAQRLTAQLALLHPWFSDPGSEPPPHELTSGSEQLPVSSFLRRPFSVPSGLVAMGDEELSEKQERHFSTHRLNVDAKGTPVLPLSIQLKGHMRPLASSERYLDKGKSEAATQKRSKTSVVLCQASSTSLPRQLRPPPRPSPSTDRRVVHSAVSSTIIRSGSLPCSPAASPSPDTDSSSDLLPCPKLSSSLPDTREALSPLPDSISGSSSLVSSSATSVPSPDTPRNSVEFSSAARNVGSDERSNYRRHVCWCSALTVAPGSNSLQVCSPSHPGWLEEYEECPGFVEEDHGRSELFLGREAVPRFCSREQINITTPKQLRAEGSQKSSAPAIIPHIHTYNEIHPLDYYDMYLVDWCELGAQLAKRCFEFRKFHPLKRAALTVIAQQIGDTFESLEQVRRFFVALDVRGSAALGVEELAGSLVRVARIDKLKREASDMNELFPHVEHDLGAVSTDQEADGSQYMSEPTPYQHGAAREMKGEDGCKHDNKKHRKGSILQVNLPHEESCANDHSETVTSESSPLLHPSAAATRSVKVARQKSSLFSLPSTYGIDEIVNLVRHIIDSDGSGLVEYTEFLAACMPCTEEVLSDRVLRAAFHVFDKDCDGKISIGELRNMIGLSKQVCGARESRDPYATPPSPSVGHVSNVARMYHNAQVAARHPEPGQRSPVYSANIGVPNVTVEDLFAAADFDGNGKITFSDFAHMIRTCDGGHDCDGTHL